MKLIMQLDVKTTFYEIEIVQVLRRNSQLTSEAKIASISTNPTI